MSRESSSVSCMTYGGWLDRLNGRQNLGGVVISADIQDNLAFKEFVEGQNLRYGLTGFEGEFVGMARKPGP